MDADDAGRSAPPQVRSVRALSCYHSFAAVLLDIHSLVGDPSLPWIVVSKFFGVLIYTNTVSLPSAVPCLVPQVHGMEKLCTL